MKKMILWAALFLITPAMATNAIIIRHDRDDARYLALGAKYPAVCFMVPDGEGTLIAPQWVLTAAHVAVDKRIEKVRFDDGAEYAITQKILHPEWRDGQPHDVALVKLAEPVRGVAPVALYEASDETGKTVTFVGRGDTGTGMSGPKAMDKKKRAATNVVDSADANWLRFTFDEPPAGTDLEGVSGPGDSGGPALIERDGKLYMAGVSVMGSRGKYGPQTYGTREAYTRVSTHLAWIRNTISGVAPQAQPAAPAGTNVQSVAPQAIPDTPAGRRMKAWLPVINSGDQAKILKFLRENFAADALEQRPAEERAKIHLNFFEETGGLKVHSVKKSEPYEVEILAQAVKSGQWFRVGLRTQAQEPYGIGGFLFDEAEPPAASGENPARQGAAVAFPATPVGRQLQAWLDAFNAPKPEALREYLKTNLSPAWLASIPLNSHVQIQGDFQEETGGLRVVEVINNSETEIAVRTQTAKGSRMMRVDFRVESAAPNRVAVMSFGPMNQGNPAGQMPGNRAPAPQGPVKSPQEISRELEAYVNGLVAKDEFSGAVLIARNGAPILEKAWGKASVRYNIPNRVDTKFNLGSMNKMFTAVAIAQLVEQGKLSFDDKVGKILPDYPNADVRNKVTLHHLLTHTSGLGSYFSSKKYEDTWLKIRTVDDFLATFADEPLRFEPGARFAYSNSGFIVLGKIVEKLSGMSYYDYVREKIFKPAGMNNTDSYALDQDEPNLATGYTRVDPLTDTMTQGPRHNNLFQHSVKGGPAGGGYSTVQDMLRFDQALRSHKLLGAKTLETLWAGKVAMGNAPGFFKYAYGFGDRDLNGTRVVGHNGGAPGISAEFNMVLGDGWTIVVLSNYDRAATVVSNRAEGLILRLPQRVIVTN